MLTCLFINYFSSMNFLVSLQMTTFSKFLRTFITFKFGLTMIQQMPCQCTFITKQFRADIALKSFFIMFNFNMSGEVVLDIIHPVTVWTREAPFFVFTNIVGFPFMSLQIL